MWFNSVVQNAELSGGVESTAIFTKFSYSQKYNCTKVIGIVNAVALSISRNSFLAFYDSAPWRVYRGTLVLKGCTRYIFATLL